MRSIRKNADCDRQSVRFVKTLTQGIQVARTGVAIDHPRAATAKGTGGDGLFRGFGMCYVRHSRPRILAVLTEEFLRVILEFVLIDTEGF